MRVLGKLGNSDAFMERRVGDCGLGIGQQCGGLCVGISQDLAGRGDRRSQD